MRTGRRGWRVLTAIVTTVALGACATDVGGPTAQSAADAGRPAASAPATGAAPAASGTNTTTATPSADDTTRDSAPRAGDADDPDGVGDELFPALGNPGLDVQHYDVELTYDHDARSLQGTVGLDVRFTEDRSAFTLDADGPIVDAVTIDGAPVDFRQDGAELRITPAMPVRAGDTHRVDVTYHLQPDSVTSATGIQVGWFNTDGGSYVLNEPDGVNRWLPSNDHPSDKATYDFTIHVGPGVTAVANGALVEHTTTADGETWRWREDEPMATYLIQLLTGDYELVEGTGPGGLPLVSAILRSELPAVQDELDSISEQIATLETVLGPYPLERYGIAVTDSRPGLAMETQGRSQYSKDDLGPAGFGGETTFVHELAHQWFGNAVTPARWQDIWLNEGFASYAQYLYAEQVGGSQGPIGPLTPDGGLGPVGEPTAANMFGSATYNGGSQLLGALRETIGDDQFFQLLRRWVADNDGTSRTTDDFVALAEEISGRDLTAFFDEWLLGADPEPATTTVTTG